MNIRKDILPITKKHILKLDYSVQEFHNIYTFYFNPTNPVDWTPGQHGIFIINDKNISKPIRPFSVASTSTEEHVMISVRIDENPSDFKQALLNLSKGDKVIMRGPVGGFYLKNTKPTLFITGGIGVTPFRSILLDTFSSELYRDINIDMLYIDDNQNYLYKTFFDNLEESNHFSIKYLNNRDTFNKELNDYVTKNLNNTNYFVTGPKAMVDHVVKLLKSNGVKKRNIVKDTFIGY